MCGKHLIVWMNLRRGSLAKGQRGARARSQCCACICSGGGGISIGNEDSVQMSMVQFLR